MRDPRPRARAHHRLERRHEAARGPLHFGAVVAAHVYVRLAVGGDQDLVAFQVLAQDAPQGGRFPADLRLVAHAALAFEVAHHRFQIPRDRAQFRRVRLRRERERLTANQRLDARHPAAPRELRDHDGDQCDDGADRREEPHDIALGVGAAQLDEAHVVHGHHFAETLFVDHDRARRHVQRAAAALHDMPRLFGGRIDRPAADIAWKSECVVHERRVAIAETDREKTLVLQHAVEKRLHALQALPVARVIGE